MSKKKAGDLYEHWNAKNAKGWRLRRYAKKCKREGALVVGFCEVWLRHDDLAKIARQMGWEMVAAKPGVRWREPISEAGDTVALVSPDFHLERDDIKKMDQHWTVIDADRVHTPRELIRLVGRPHGQRAEVIVAHGPTDNWKNVAAVNEFKTALTLMLTKTRDDTVSIAIGDMNLRIKEVLPWARPHGIDVDGWGPDLALVRGARVKSKRGKTKRGSDHYPVSHRITKESRR